MLTIVMFNEVSSRARDFSYELTVLKISQLLIFLLCLKGMFCLVASPGKLLYFLWPLKKIGWCFFCCYITLFVHTLLNHCCMVLIDDRKQGGNLHWGWGGASLLHFKFDLHFRISLNNAPLTGQAPPVEKSSELIKKSSSHLVCL